MPLTKQVGNQISFLKLGLVQPELMRLARSVKKSHKSYLSYTRLLSLVNNFQRLRSRKVEGISAAEFGVGFGGTATVIGWLIEHYGGRLYLFDVFDRIPPPTPKDGQAASERYQFILTKEDREHYYGNVQGLLDRIKDQLKTTCSLDRVEFIQGRFEETLPNLGLRTKLDFVHVDCDWYDSTRTVLAFLERQLNPGAILQIDDYAFWEGTKLAVDEAGWLASCNKRLVDGAVVFDLDQQ
jgi:O-methyltransferase